MNLRYTRCFLELGQLNWKVAMLQDFKEKPFEKQLAVLANIEQKGQNNAVNVPILGHAVKQWLKGSDELWYIFIYLSGWKNQA